MEKEINEETIEKLKLQIKELEQLQRKSYEDIEEDPLTTLDKELAKKYKEIFLETLKICKKEDIKEFEIFDEKYPMFQWGIENFIENYANHINYCTQISKQYINQEIEMLKTTISQFNLDKENKREYELQIIKDMHILGDKKEAQEKLEEWIKANPSKGEAYEVKCDWELEKEKPDMEKIAQILEEADNNDTFIPDKEIYKEIIQYYENLENEEMAQYYESLLEFSEEEDYYDIYDTDDEDDIEDDDEI